MINVTNELKEKLLAAKSAEEAAGLLRETGQDVGPEQLPQLWVEIERLKELADRTLSRDEMEAVAGGISGPVQWPTDCTLVML